MSVNGDWSSPPAPTFRIIGTLVDSGRVYVMYLGTEREWRMNPLSAPAPRIMQLERTLTGWRILPRSDLMGLADLVDACG